MPGDPHSSAGIKPASPMCRSRPPSASEAASECGWTLGFRAGEHCTETRADDADFCPAHAKADRRIGAYAKRSAKRARYDLERGYGGIHELELTRDPRAIAERWWVESGVRRIPAPLRREVLDCGPCVYCGHHIPTEIDHVIPVSRGGLSEPGNLEPACERCNGEKLDFTVDEWRQRRLRQGLSWPPKTIVQLADEAFARALDGNPPWFLADLLDIAEPEERPARYADDPRWQMANEAWLGNEPELGPDEQFMLRKLAIEVMYEIELTYESEDAS